MSTFMYAYNANSEGAINLSQSLGVRRIRHENSRFRGSPNKTVINWGSSQLPDEITGCQIINSPEAVGICSNKLTFFQHVERRVQIPEFTHDIDVARSWIRDEAIVICRRRLQGHGGDGIVVATNEDQLENVRLYTRYIPKRNEYRVHVLRGRVIGVQRKALQEGAERHENTFRIRNAQNGFIFARNEDHQVPECVTEQALAAVNAVEGLDFGGVDVIYNERRNAAYVLEINTAPGITGTTVEEYTNAFREILND